MMAKLPSKVVITIELGNDAMQSLIDVIGALHQLSNRLSLRIVNENESWDDVIINDVNGNIVGKFSAK